jgi:hypothetical protein
MFFSILRGEAVEQDRSKAGWSFQPMSENDLG